MSDSLMPIMEKGEARALGLKKYFTGRPCIRGHLAERFTKGGKCLECNREFVRADRRAGHPKLRRITPVLLKW